MDNDLDLGPEEMGDAAVSEEDLLRDGDVDAVEDLDQPGNDGDEETDDGGLDDGGEGGIGDVDEMGERAGIRPDDPTRELGANHGQFDGEETPDLDSVLDETI